MVSTSGYIVSKIEIFYINGEIFMKKLLVEIFVIGFFILGVFGGNTSLGKNQYYQQFDTFGQYDLVIISPEQFSLALQPLVNHKNTYNMHTFLKTTQEIYDECLEC